MLAKHNPQAQADSCGFESFHVGDRPDNRAQVVARNHGIDISSHKARLFTTADFDRFDLIFVMDATHYRQVMSNARNEHDRKKVDYLMNILTPGTNQPVNDPWYEDQRAFELVYQQMEPACKAIAGIITGVTS